MIRFYATLFIVLSLFSNNSFAIIDLACQKDCLARGNETNYCSQACSYNPVSKNASYEGLTADAKSDNSIGILNPSKELKLPTQLNLPKQDDYLRSTTAPSK